MKALTVYQPWASLIMAGVKAMETRPNRTRHRGPLAIHAGKLTYWQLVDMLGYDEVNRLDDICRKAKLPPVACLPRGCALGTVTLANVGRIDRGYEPSERLVYWERAADYGVTGWIGSDEYALGDYTIGHHAWHMIQPHAFPEPIPARGMQGMWEWDGML
jgi:hypothetical protein